MSFVFINYKNNLILYNINKLKISHTKLTFISEIQNIKITLIVLSSLLEFGKLYVYLLALINTSYIYSHCHVQL